MKGSILHTVLIAVTFAAILFAAIDPPQTSPAATAQAARVYTMEKTVVAAKRLPADTAAEVMDVTLIASTAR